jgi:hypothetical protein
VGANLLGVNGGSRGAGGLRQAGNFSHGLVGTLLAAHKGHSKNAGGKSN